jgi:hypothetical protein
MREIDARVTGFDYTTHHSYTTEVEVDGRTWTLGIRYNTFYQFYTRLTALEKHFNVDFPPKGGLFFSPPPDERQEQLDDFLLSTLAYFDMRGHPRRMEALLGELLQVPEHLDIKDDEERTASEGSSVAEELLLDGLSTPMPGHDDEHDDFLESGHEGDDHDGLENHLVQGKVEVDNQVEDLESKAAVDDAHQDSQASEGDHEEEVVVPVELEEKPEAVEAEEEEKPEAVEVKPAEKQEVVEDASSPTSESKVQPAQGQDLTGGSVAKDYIAMLRRRTLVNGAIQAAVVNTMKESVVKIKAEATSEALKGDKERNTVEVEETIAQKASTPEQEEQAAAPEEPAIQAEAAPAEPATNPVAQTPVPVLEVPEVVSIAPEEEAGRPLEPVVAGADNEDKLEQAPIASVTETTEQDVIAEESAPASVSETEAAEPAAPPAEADESSSEEEEEAASEPSRKEAESENAVVGWFRRMGTFGPSAAEKEEDAVAAKEKEKQEAAARAEADAEKEAVARAEAEIRAKAEAEAAEAELLRAEQELNLRLKLYRHPVFFQGFNCDVGTSRYSLPERQSDGIIV